jgi:hypothetical protein
MSIKKGLHKFCRDLADFAGVDAAYVAEGEQHRIRINGVDFFWNHDGCYDGWEVEMEAKWHNDLRRYIDTGEASPEFLAFLDANPTMQQVADRLLNARQRGVDDDC